MWERAGPWQRSQETLGIMVAWSSTLVASVGGDRRVTPKAIERVLDRIHPAAVRVARGMSGERQTRSHSGSVGMGERRSAGARGRRGDAGLGRAWSRTSWHDRPDPKAYSIKNRSTSPSRCARSRTGRHASCISRSHPGVRDLPSRDRSAREPTSTGGWPKSARMARSTVMRRFARVALAAGSVSDVQRIRRINFGLRP